MPPNRLSSARRAARYDRGSKQRLRRIRIRGNSSLAFWIFVVGILLILFGAVPWFASHAPQQHEQTD
jgi:hypothetical protein